MEINLPLFSVMTQKESNEELKRGRQEEWGKGRESKGRKKLKE